MNYLEIDDFIKRALNEDINYGDITTDTLFSGSQISNGKFISKSEGIVSGIKVAERVFHIIDENVAFEVFTRDGSRVKEGDVIAGIHGPSNSILKGERVALNIVQRMSGISTKTNEFVELVKGYDVKILDTRKTLPGFRMLDKYAVTCGGGFNHRFGLSDFVMIKDNHIKAVGSIEKAVSMIKEKLPFRVKIEVEVENIEQLEEAVASNVDIIMLDNMSLNMMKKAVQIVGGRCLLEASGNVTEENVSEIASSGINFISVGSLTHSVCALDISLKF